MTRWGSYQKEGKIFNCKCHDLHESLHNMLDDGGCDNDLMKGKGMNPEEVRTEHTLQPDQWIFASIRGRHGSNLPVDCLHAE